MESLKGIEFLTKVYKDLIIEEKIVMTSNGRQKKVKLSKEEKKAVIEDLSKEIERINRVLIKTNERKNLSNDDRIKIFSELLYPKCIIKEENIPQGRDKETIIKEQKESLDKWIKYLSDENTMYPAWVKYFVFRGMLKIGTQNELGTGYYDRDETTISKFIDCNPEALSKTIEIITKYIDENQVDDPALKQIVESGNFKKIYTHFIMKYKKEIILNSNKKEGVWVKYNEGSEEDAIKLSKSIEGKNTGWCTAGKEMAKYQVCGGKGYPGGNFYVYYTKDKNNEYKLPRIAIRMDKDIVGEIRGISGNQNLEEGLEEILEKKLNSLNLCYADIYLWKTRINDMKMLSKINKKAYKKEELTHEELLFIYQVYNEIYGFGRKEDPRIKRIINGRDKKEDYKKFNKSEILKFIQRGNNVYTLFEKGNINDKDIMVAILKKHGGAFDLASPKLQSDRGIVKYAVSRDGKNLKYASEELKNDKEVVMVAVSKDGSALEYASERLRNDKELVSSLIDKTSDVFILEFVSDELKNDKDFVTEIIKIYPYAFRYLSDKLKADKELALLAANSCNGDATFIYGYASLKLRNDKKFIMDLIKISFIYFNDISEELKNDKEVVLEFFKRGENVYDHLSEELRKDKDVILAAVKVDKRVVSELPIELQKDRNFALEVVKQNVYALAYFNQSVIKSLKNDKEFIKQLREWYIKQSVEKFRDNRKTIYTFARKKIKSIVNRKLRGKFGKAKENKTL